MDREDADEFSEVFRENLPALSKFCLKLTGGDRTSAEDLCQEAMLAALLHWEELDDREELLPWLCTVAKRTYYDRVRSAELSKRAAEPPSELRLEGSSLRLEELEPEEMLEWLPEKQAEVLRKRYLEGMALKEIAERRGVSPGTVYSQHHRGLEKLREIWKKSGKGTQGSGGGVGVLRMRRKSCDLKSASPQYYSFWF